MTLDELNDKLGRGNTYDMEDVYQTIECAALRGDEYIELYRKWVSITQINKLIRDGYFVTSCKDDYLKVSGW